MARHESISVIYGLRCPKANAIRYIGKADDPIKRLTQHIAEALRGEHHHRGHWLRALQPHTPAVVELFRAGDDWQMWERFFIASALAFGFRLTNSTAGGDGVVDLSDDARERMLSKLKSVENRERAGQHSKALWSKPGMQQIKSDATKAAWSDPEKRKTRSMRIAEGKLRAWQELRFRAASGDVLAQAKIDSRAELMQSIGRSPEARVKQAESLRLTLAEPEARKKISDAVRASMTPETRAKHKAAQQLRQQRARAEKEKLRLGT